MRYFISVRRLAVFAVLAALFFSLSFGPNSRKVYAGSNCGVVNSVCFDLWWEGMFPLCMATIGTYSTCSVSSTAGYASCVTDAGCPLNN